MRRRRCSECRRELLRGRICGACSQRRYRRAHMGEIRIYQRGYMRIRRAAKNAPGREAFH